MWMGVQVAFGLNSQKSPVNLPLSRFSLLKHGWIIEKKRLYIKIRFPSKSVVEAFTRCRTTFDEIFGHKVYAAAPVLTEAHEVRRAYPHDLQVFLYQKIFNGHFWTDIERI